MPHKNIVSIKSKNQYILKPTLFNQPKPNKINDALIKTQGLTPSCNPAAKGIHHIAFDISLDLDHLHKKNILSLAQIRYDAFWDVIIYINDTDGNALLIFPT